MSIWTFCPLEVHKALAIYVLISISLKTIDAFCMTYNIFSIYYVFQMPDAGVRSSLKPLLISSWNIVVLCVISVEEPI